MTELEVIECFKQLVYSMDEFPKEKAFLCSGESDFAVNGDQKYPFFHLQKPFNYSYNAQGNRFIDTSFTVTTYLDAKSISIDNINAAQSQCLEIAEKFIKLTKKTSFTINEKEMSIIIAQDAVNGAGIESYSTDDVYGVTFDITIKTNC